MLMCGRTLTRKTSLLRKIEPIARRSSFANEDHLQPALNLTTEASAEMIPEIVIESRELLRRIQTRIDLLFTMSDIPHDAVHPDKRARSDVRGRNIRGTLDLRFHLVEPDGIEPTTSCLQSTRSPS